MRKLAIDLGTKKTGFAISDETNTISIALDTLVLKNCNFSLIINHIKSILHKYEIDAIILGYPLRQDKTKSERTFLVENFFIYLKKTFKLEIFLQNEYNSSIIANKILISADLSRKKRKKLVDKIAAQIILEDYLKLT